MLIPINNITKFKENIGYRYCCHKSQRLEVYYSFLKYRERIIDQRTNIIKDIERKYIDGIVLKELYNDYLNNYDEIILHPHSIPSYDSVHDKIHSFRHDNTPIDIVKQVHISGLNINDFINKVESNVFNGYGVNEDKDTLPTFNLKVISIKNIGKKQTYDIEVSNNHNFIANGIIVHNCEHDTNKRKSKLSSDKIFCTDKDMDGKPYRFRFLKKPQGILPRLLKDLLDTRKKTKTEMKKVKSMIKGEEDEEKKQELEVLMDVLDKRQLAFKVSANSVYGSLGTRKGYLPFLPGAMCTTAMGRYNIKLAAKHLQEQYGGTLIYGDTDSNYIHFPFMDNKPAHELWDHCLEVEKSINAIFPEPMKLLFEEAIYSRFFILTKKRYMALKMDRDGDIKDGIEKRGVLLQRRDNAEVIRHIYGNIVMRIFEDKEKKDKEGVINYLIDELNYMCSYKYNTNDYIITKSVGDKADYKIKPLPEDLKKRDKRFKDLQIKSKCICSIPCKSECFKKCKACDEYLIRTLPAHIQLAEKIRRRGKNVQVGSRMEYIISRPDIPEDKLFNKLEDPEYQKEFSEYSKIDFLYYIGLMIKPFDETLQVGYNIENLVKQQYKLRLQKYKILNQIKQLNYSQIE